MSTGLKMTDAQEQSVCETYKREGRASALGVMRAFFNHTPAENADYQKQLDIVLVKNKLIKNKKKENKENKNVGGVKKNNPEVKKKATDKKK